MPAHRETRRVFVPSARGATISSYAAAGGGGLCAPTQTNTLPHASLCFLNDGRCWCDLEARGYTRTYHASLPRRIWVSKRYSRDKRRTIHHGAAASSNSNSSGRSSKLMATARQTPHSGVHMGKPPHMLTQRCSARAVHR